MIAFDLFFLCDGWVDALPKVFSFDVISLDFFEDSRVSISLILEVVEIFLDPEFDLISIVSFLD